MTDVTAGFLLGFLWLLVSISMVEYLSYLKMKKASLHLVTNLESTKQ